MANRVLHIERGFHMSVAFAEQVMREHCSFVWIAKGQTVRDATAQEMTMLRAEQVNLKRLSEAKLGIMGMRAEIAGTRFEPPSSTKYRAPREAYEEMQEPLGVRVCHWPRFCAESVA